MYIPLGVGLMTFVMNANGYWTKLKNVIPVIEKDENRSYMESTVEIEEEA